MDPREDVQSDRRNNGFSFYESEPDRQGRRRKEQGSNRCCKKAKDFLCLLRLEVAAGAESPLAGVVAEQGAEPDRMMRL